MTQVKCKVKSCQHYGEDDICTADSILVDCNQKLSGSSTGMEVGTMDFEVGGFGTGASDRGTKSKGSSGKCDANNIKTSEETLCSTFVPKGSGPRH